MKHEKTLSEYVDGILDCKKKIVTTSLELAKYLDRDHDEILSEIATTQDYGGGILARHSKMKTYVDEHGHKQPVCHMEREIFLFLTLGYWDAKSIQVQIILLSRLVNKIFKGLLNLKRLEND
jgi:phage regulator Rha-like protein